MSTKFSSPQDGSAERHRIQTIIRNADYEGLVEFAESKARGLAAGGEEASKAQIRRIFGEIKQIEMRWPRDSTGSVQRLRMLKPRLVYAAARPNVGRGIQRLREVLIPAVDAVLEAQDPATRSQRFRTFVQFTEALLAYFSAEKGGGQGATGATPRRQGGR